jgi:hypothetical protein
VTISVAIRAKDVKMLGYQSKQVAGPFFVERALVKIVRNENVHERKGLLDIKRTYIDSIEVVRSARFSERSISKRFGGVNQKTASM